MKLNGLEEYFETVNGEIVDFFQDKRGWTPLMFALFNNKENDLNLSNAQFDYLIKNSNLAQVSRIKQQAVVYAFNWLQLENLNLNNEQLDYLIKNSNLEYLDGDDKSILMYALNNYENLNLSNETWKYMINNSDLSIIKNKEQLIELKKIQSNLLNEEILNKVNIKEDYFKNKKVKI